MQFRLHDGDEHIGGHRYPNLRLHRILARSQKTLNAQMLLGPFEEQLHLPAALVKRSNDQRRQSRVVGQKHQRLACLGIFEADTPQMLGIILGDIKPIQRDHLIANHTGCAVGRRRVHAPGIHTALDPRDEVRAGLMHLVQSVEVQIAAIHH